MNALPVRPDSERTQAQRERILAAAKKCFIEHGFHAAGMARIAETAGMSQGLIYRYFANKHAIILAIIERQLAKSRDDICNLSKTGDFAQAIYEVFDRWQQDDPEITNAALFLEMTAEAPRSAELAAAMQASDLELRREFCKWLALDVEQGGKGMTQEVAEVRALGLQCFIEGLAVRALREPKLDRKLLHAAIKTYLDALVTP